MILLGSLPELHRVVGAEEAGEPTETPKRINNAFKKIKKTRLQNFL